jgi:AcrR family transcriptional regulator
VTGTRKARGEARREQILDVAMRTFAAHGFRGASLSAIAAEAELSEPGLLHHFASKRELLLAVLLETEARAKALAAERDGDYTGLLVEIARGHEADPSFIRFFLVLSAESLDPAHPAHDWFRDRYDRTRALLAEWIADDQRRGLVRVDVDAALAARTIVAVLDGLELQHLLAGGGGISAPLELYVSRLRRSAPAGRATA